MIGNIVSRRQSQRIVGIVGVSSSNMNHIRRRCMDPSKQLCISTSHHFILQRRSPVVLLQQGLQQEEYLTSESSQVRYFSSNKGGNKNNKKPVASVPTAEFRSPRPVNPSYRPVQPPTIKKKVRGKDRGFDKVVLNNNRPKIVSSFTDLPPDVAVVTKRFGGLTAEMFRDIQRRHENMSIFQYQHKPITTPNKNDSTALTTTTTTTEENQSFDDYYPVTDRNRYQAMTDEVEEDLRTLDYFLSEPGSTEHLVHERRNFDHDYYTPAEKDMFRKELKSIAESQQLLDLDLDDIDIIPDEDRALHKAGNQPAFKVSDENDYLEELMARNITVENYEINREEMDPLLHFDPRALAHGTWSEMLICTNRTNKLWRGGRLESYRALVIGGNFNGCGGFGIGKGESPADAIDAASRKCKKNIFFIERFQQDSLASDLFGKQNSCRVQLFAHLEGLRGNPLICQILMRMGITNGTGTSHGNRSPYNVVRATFKAVMTHESLEEIAMKRGKRLSAIEKNRRLGIY